MKSYRVCFRNLEKNLEKTFIQCKMSAYRTFDRRVFLQCSCYKKVRKVPVKSS